MSSNSFQFSGIPETLCQDVQKADNNFNAEQQDLLEKALLMQLDTERLIISVN